MPKPSMIQNNTLLRRIPSVDRMMSHPGSAALTGRVGRESFLRLLRQTLASLRKRLRKNSTNGEAAEAMLAEAAILDEVRNRMESMLRPGLRRVINATGIILHTGLGRAVLPPAAMDSVRTEQAGYSMLEVDEDTGDRGIRETHAVKLLRELTGAQAGTVVNNNAGATLIALAALARGKEVIVSRGQLVEIGGSFRIPEVMESSGATLIEVGTTNKTYLNDYARKISARTALLLRVHTSNYRVAGFTHTVPLAELIKLGKKHGLPVMDDLGSGSLADLRPWGLSDEPTVQESVRAGAHVITFSGDKLLGGPQAGIIIGKKDLIARIRSHPLFRALRVDKLTLTALEATLKLYRNPERLLKDHPTMSMISMDEEELARRAARLQTLIQDCPGVRAEIQNDYSEVGGGSVPMQNLSTRVVSVMHGRLSPDALASRMRSHRPAIFARIKKDRILFDVRTLLEPDFDDLRAFFKHLHDELQAK